MPRTMRPESPGTIYDVMDWGHRREDIHPFSALCKIPLGEGSRNGYLKIACGLSVS
jgi:hypothetical protein